MQKKTIGGDRIGAGKKMQAELHDYYRSTFNLSEKFASTMGAGILYPCLCKLATRGDSFDIDLSTDLRTIPTMGALFGSFKFDVHIYQVPIRLYQALLHNNPLAIGLNASQIKMPLINVQSFIEFNNTKSGAFSNSSLLKYLGLSGLGYCNRPAGSVQAGVMHNRKFNAIPILAYYDIFKNYYSNKQEDKAYIITTKSNGMATSDVSNFIVSYKTSKSNEITREYRVDQEFERIDDTYDNKFIITIFGTNLNNGVNISVSNGNSSDSTSLLNLQNIGVLDIAEQTPEIITCIVNVTNFKLYYDALVPQFKYIYVENAEGELLYKSTLTPFDLKNIDDMRYDILSSHTLGVPFVIGREPGEKGNYLPYQSITTWTDEKNVSANMFPLNGLVVKTYQNDLYNNWLDTEWIEGENSISELSKVAIVDGAFSMDSLNLAQKIYNMLNRVAISGGTYEDYQDVVWEEVKRRQIESPIFCGGMSQEIMFDEVIQTAPAGGDTLGTLGGRGRLAENRKGGKLHIKCDEACFIIGIASITPRVFYTQGNEFYMTDILSFDDLHKPALDGIGFQDLIGERMAFFDTILTKQAGQADSVVSRSKIGKVPAWIEYMTSVDKAYGDFADVEGFGYMILNRNYEQQQSQMSLDNDTGIDFTTYIDPAKYNYAFAYSALDSQNFWVEIGFDIKARRLMSSRLIPNV